MADEVAAEPTEINPERLDSAAENMDLVEGSNGTKRARGEQEEAEELNCDMSKKQKVDDTSVGEEWLEKKEEEEEEGEGRGQVNLGPKNFGSSVEMFDYFYGFLHYWPPNLDVNKQSKYEHMVLLELLKKGHSEPEKKIGNGIQAFQVRYHPTWKSRCFFLIRDDDSVDDFSFRKCVDHILPLPEDMKIKPNANKLLGGGKGGKGGGGTGGWAHGCGRGRGGKSRN